MQRRSTQSFGRSNGTCMPRSVLDMGGTTRGNEERAGGSTDYEIYKFIFRPAKIEKRELSKRATSSGVPNQGAGLQ